MAKKTIFYKFKAKAVQNEANRADVRFVKAIALFKGKGLLNTNLPITAAPGMRIHIDDVLWAGRNVEPRLLETLPAAILRYRNNFLGLEVLPPELEQAIKCIRMNADIGPDFEGVPYNKLKFWANTRLRDKRTKPTNLRKQFKGFRLSLKTLKKLQDLVEDGKFKDQTSALEAAVEKL